MARHKDEDWCLPEGIPKKDGGATHQWDSINVALLMDIRDRLDVLKCGDFLAIPYRLTLIERAVKSKHRCHRAHMKRGKK